MMKLVLLSTLVLSSLCSLSSWGVSSTDNLTVSQSPDVVTATEGETVHLKCCWNIDFTRLTLNWLKDGTRITSSIIIKSQCEQGNIACNCSDITFPNIATNDSGRYICKVSIDIPELAQSQGNGTVVVVTATYNTSQDQHDNSAGSGVGLPLNVMIPLAVVAPLFLLALICLWSLWRRQGSQRAARVIYEVPHQDSEEPEMDRHSTTSSKGSSQWCQVPVYESFDYFERVEDKVKSSG